jgi:hypothetical protein
VGPTRIVREAMTVCYLNKFVPIIHSPQTSTYTQELYHKELQQEVVLRYRSMEAIVSLIIFTLDAIIFLRTTLTSIQTEMLNRNYTVQIYT